VDPTDAKAAGIAFWNGLPLEDRADCMHRAASTGIVVDLSAAKKG